MGFLFFLSSLVPLGLCISVMYSDTKQIWIPAVVAISIGVIFLTLLLIVLRKKCNKVNGLQQTFSKIKLDRHIPIDFLFAYVLPLIAFDLRDWRQAICFGVILSVYMILYLRNNTYHVNIILYLLGYKAYHCQDSNGNSVMVIAKKGWESYNISKAMCMSLCGNDVWIVIKHLSLSTEEL